MVYIYLIWYDITEFVQQQPTIGVWFSQDSCLFNVSYIYCTDETKKKTDKDATDTVKYPTYIGLYLEFGSNNKT
jgi:hypothetical protein